MIASSALIDLFKHALSEKWGYIWGTAGVKWTEAKQKAKVDYMAKNFGENWKKNADAKSNNYYTAALYGSKWVGHTVADCSGLFYWAFKKLGGSIYHGSNTIYDKYCSKHGKITDDIRKTMLPGTAVFVDHSGKKTHIGLYVGNGKVIEASSTEAGVITSKLTANKWTYYGLLKGVSYSTQNTAQNTPETPSKPEDDKIPTSSLPTLKKGCTGEYVTLLQTTLMNQGYDLGKYGVDGDFGSATLSAVKKFQKDHDLTVDGIVGKATWAKLMNNTQAVFYTVSIPHLTAERADQVIALYDGAYKEQERG